MTTYKVNKSYIDESNKSRVVKEDGEFAFIKIKPCKDCGSEEIKTYYPDLSQYSIWIDQDRYTTTLVKGTEPIKFGNGSADPDCYEHLHTFISESYEAASEYYHNWTLKNIRILPT